MGEDLTPELMFYYNVLMQSIKRVKGHKHALHTKGRCKQMPPADLSLKLLYEH